MAWTVPKFEDIEKQYLVSKQILEQELFNRDVVLLGGNTAIDDLRFDLNDSRFFVQLNHHLNRRHWQPCDWLIARAGSGMDYNFLKAKVRDYQIARIKVVSTACNKHTFETWSEYYPVFPFHEIQHAGLNPFHPCLEWCNQFWNEINTNPLMGMLALKMILMFPIKSVELVGFDFFSTEVGYLKKNLGCHNLTSQVKWLRHLYFTDFRIIVDKRLEKILNPESRNRYIPKTYDLDE